MGSYGLIDAVGWIDGIVETEGEFNPKDYPCVAYVELKKEEVEKIVQSQLTMFWDGSKFCQIKNPKDIWKRLRSIGFNGRVCEKTLRHHVEQIDDNYSDIPIGIITSRIDGIKRTINPSFECELLPGLRICLSDEDDLEIWESQMIKSDLYTADQAWSIAAQWLSDPMSWPIKTIWKDKIIQIEIYHFDLNNPYTVCAGFTAHIDRIRPLWFWKQLIKPIFRNLYVCGFEVIRSSIRKDKINWIEFLKDGYGAEELDETDSGIRLRYQIRDSLQKIGDWPERKTLGIGWNWNKNGVLVREAMESDLITLREAMDISWGNSSRKVWALEMLEDRWILDKATVLLAFYDGKIIDANVIRKRKDPTISFVGVPFKRTFESQETQIFRIATEGFLTWQKEAGYKTSSFIIETKLYETMKNTLSKWGWKFYTEKSGITEGRRNIEEQLNAIKR